MPPRLDRPPIVEALLDFRVDASDPDDTAESLGAFADSISEAYPTEVDLPQVDGMPPAIRALMAESKTSRLRSADGARTVLVGPSRVTFSVTFDWPDRVYTSWSDDLVAPAFQVWAAYEEHVRPRALASLATRFVNRLRVKPDRLDEVLTDPPSLPSGALTLSSSTDYRTGRTSDGFGARIGRRLGGHGPDTTRATLFLDVEAFVTYDDDPKPTPLGVDTLAGDLARLDAIKNDLFFSSLTPASLDLYRDDDA